jgi:hypothetical protein
MIRYQRLVTGSQLQIIEESGHSKSHMNKELIVLIAAGLLPAYANAAKLDLKQDLGGLDLVVAIKPPPPSDPVAIRITNKSKVVASCALNYTGADATMMTTTVIQPGESDTLLVTADATDAQLSGKLKCTEKKAASK